MNRRKAEKVAKRVRLLAVALTPDATNLAEDLKCAAVDLILSYRKSNNNLARVKIVEDIEEIAFEARCYAETILRNVGLLEDAV